VIKLSGDLDSGHCLPKSALFWKARKRCMASATGRFSHGKQWHTPAYLADFVMRLCSIPAAYSHGGQ
jgi:hypothetical protein